MYMFWCFFKRCSKNKGDIDSGYFAAILVLGFVPFGVPISALIWNLLKISDYSNNAFKIFLYFFLFFVCSTIPMCILFPKKKILSLEYTAEEKKHYNRQSLYFLLVIIGLIVLKVLYNKYFR